jgi:hypothetical protein
MAMEITVRNINDALPTGLSYLNEEGVPESSRYGDVLVYPEPFTTVYVRPTERVLFSPTRNANPWFHLLGDALWLLAGRNDIEWPCYFNARFKEFSDDGIIAPGAYGFRWREYFGVDQLEMVVTELIKNRNSRRAVLQMWHPEDFSRLLSQNGTRDAPCNVAIFFDCRNDALNMTVLCRSNDVWWGAYGANVVQFSVLQELLASWIGVPVGYYRQLSNNFHLYTNIVTPEIMDAVLAEEFSVEYPEAYPLVKTSAPGFLSDLEMFMQEPLQGGVSWGESFFPAVAVPMFAAWKQRKEKQGDGLLLAQQIEALDWRKACVEWIERAEARRDAKEEAQ